MWFSISLSTSGRPAVAVPLIEAGFIEVAIATLQRSSPIEWVSTTTQVVVLGTAIFWNAYTLSTLELPMNKTQLLLDKGLW